MSGGDLIAGMWGTTTLRLMLLQANAANGFAVAGMREGPGASRLDKTQFEDALFDLADDWLDSRREPDIILAGMVGSTIGWRDVGYLPCPADLCSGGLHERFTARGRDISILKGLSCANVFGEPDILRGEETEIIGCLALNQETLQGRRLLCIPGTHAKWIRLSDGVVIDFATSVAGETFAMLRESGVLIDRRSLITDAAGGAFYDGVKAAFSEQASLLHQLFSVRARRVTGLDSSSDSVDRMSGLIIGADVRVALTLLQHRHDDSPVIVVGAPGVAERYRLAIEAFGVDCQTIDAGLAAAHGFWSVKGKQ